MNQKWNILVSFTLCLALTIKSGIIHPQLIKHVRNLNMLFFIFYLKILKEMGQFKRTTVQLTSACEITKYIDEILKKSSSPEPLNQFQPNLAQIILG